MLDQREVMEACLAALEQGGLVVIDFAAKGMTSIVMVEGNAAVRVRDAMSRGG